MNCLQEWFILSRTPDLRWDELSSGGASFILFVHIGLKVTRFEVVNFGLTEVDDINLPFVIGMWTAVNVLNKVSSFHQNCTDTEHSDLAYRW